MDKNRTKIRARVSRRDLIKFLILGGIVLLMIALTLWLLPWILSLGSEEGRAALQQYIHSKGAWGVLILLGIQVLQVVVAVIPGEPVEVISGLLYGTFGGWAICSAGALAGTVIIYYLVRGLGASFVHDLVDEKKLARFRVLQDSRRLETLTFVLFFIPGTPKDVLTYFLPLTKICPLAFFLITTLARIPAIVSSTFAGASIGEGKWMQTVLIFAVIGVLGLAGIWLNNRLLARMNARRAARKRGDKPE